MNDILNIQVVNYPNKIFIVYNNKKISYQNFNNMVNNNINLLKNLNNEYIGIQIKDKLKFLITIIAINRLGKIPILYPNYPNIQDYIKSTGHSISLTDNDIKVNEKNTKSKEIIYNKHSIQLVIFTSGSTGMAKPCQLTFDNLYQSSVLWHKVMKFNQHDIYLNHMPLNHVSGLCIFFRALYNNFTMIMNNFNISNYMNYIEHNQINIISMVPYMLKKIVQNNNYYKLKNLKAIIIGGDQIDKGLIQIINKNEIPAYISYGMTETSSGIAGYWANNNYKYQPHANVDIDVNNNKIRIKSKTVMHGYMNNKPTENIYQTNDMGMLDKNGLLSINKRQDDVIVSKGEKFSANYTKLLIESLQEVNNCKLKVIKNTLEGMSIHAYINLDKEIDKDELHIKLKNILPYYMIPNKITIL